MEDLGALLPPEWVALWLTSDVKHMLVGVTTLQSPLGLWYSEWYDLYAAAGTVI